MSVNDASWLSETQIQDLFLKFPLALAVLDPEGNVKLLNQRFTDSFDATCLKTEPLLGILRDPHDYTRAPIALHCKDGTSPVFVRAVKVGGNIILVLEKSAEIAFRSELIELRNRIVELEKLSSTDRLTGAWNRTHFDKTTAIELSRSVRYRQPVSLLLMDIDHFKQVNDTYGHDVGDRVLCELVKIVRNNIRTSDMLFRWGGEEFVILAPSTSFRAAAKLAEALRSKVERHEMDAVGNITISLGVAEHVSGESETTWFRRTDEALYAAKNSGRNRAVVDQHGSSELWFESEGAAVLHLSWHESYDCGEPTIDGEHRRLFELANALITAAFNRKSSPSEFDDALQKLLAHIVQHFADEEDILAQHGYPELEMHAQSHKRLVERAMQLRDSAATGGVTVGELVDFLADEVVTRHMLKADRAFYPLFGRSASSGAD